MNSPFVPRTKLLWHEDRIYQIVHGGGTTAPVTVEIYPTYYCNLRCRSCDFKHTNLQTKKVAIDAALCVKAIKDMGDLGVRGINWGGGGEPTLHHALPRFIEAVADTDMTQGIFTNGTILSDKLIDSYLQMAWVRFSINAGTPRTYGDVHGTTPDTFYRVLKNLGYLVAQKQKRHSETTVGVSMFVNGQNYKSVRTLGDLVSDIGVDYFQVRPDTSADPNCISTYLNHIVTAVQDAPWKDIICLTQYRWLDAQSPPNFGRNYTMCHVPWLISVIGAEGKVWPCSEMAGVDGEELGDLHDKSFGEIFTTDNVNAFIARKSVKTCRRLCKGHETNKDLHLRFNIDKKKHPNHI